MEVSRIILADNQYITREGARNVLSRMGHFEFKDVLSRKELLAELSKDVFIVVVLDYSLFDFRSVDELLNIGIAYPNVHWLLFSSELSDEFIRRAYFNSPDFSILYKDSSADEIRTAFLQVIRKSRYVCSVASNVLLSNVYKQKTEAGRTHLTATELEILKEIASGKTTKEIAEIRHSSMHTIISHRKNIFRKIEVNNVYEATKYAVKAGLIDLSDYYI